MNCPNHPNIPAIRTCSECGGHFCNTCVPLKRGSTICKNCRDDLALIKSREEEKSIENSGSKDQFKARDIKSSRINSLISSATVKSSSVSGGPSCYKHSGVKVAALCCRCRKNICEVCIAFNDKEDIICQECWNKIPLTARLSRKSKGRW